MKPYVALWLLLSSALAVVWGINRFFWHGEPEPEPPRISPAVTSLTTFQQPESMDSVSILFIGDSMLEGLGPRIGAYARANGHKLHNVIWYGSSTQTWATCDSLPRYIARYHPAFIMVCIGSNELFLRNPDQRANYVHEIVKQMGNVPYLWIGPANPKPDTGIIRVIKGATSPETFFSSSGLKLQRASDGIHPTRRAASTWADSVVKWMNTSLAVAPSFDSIPAPKQLNKAATLTILTPPQ